MATEKIVCDTDVMVDYFNAANKRHVDTKLLLEERISLTNVVLSAVTKMELLIGALDKAALHRVTKKLNRFDTALINDDITVKALELIQTYSLSHGLAIPDGIIAATAIVNDLELFTYNIRDYKFISGLSLFKP